MRPLELTLEGFRSYRESTTFDWRGRRLVAIVGPIGSGKSSILDGIAFALYGRTPVLSSENSPLIRHGSDAARVELGFEIDGQTWWAVRVLKRKGANKHTLTRLDGETAVEVLDREREVTARVEQLLGLDFSAFCRSVFLAQNRFAEFLEASTRERDEVLKGLFGLDRLDDVRARARQRSNQAEAEVRGLEVRLAELEDDRTRLADVRRALDEAEQQRRRLEASAPKLSEAQQEQERTREAVAVSRARRAELERLQRQLPSTREIRGVLEALANSTAQREATQEAWSDARRQRRQAREKLTQLRTELGSEVELARAQARWEGFQKIQQQGHRSRAQLEAQEGSVRRAADAIDEAREHYETKQKAAQQAETASQEAVSLEQDTQEAVRRARQALDDAQRLEMAATLRQQLRQDEPCPVCQQPAVLDLLSTIDAPPAVATAQEHLRQLERSLEQQRERARQLQREANQAQRRVDSAQQAVDAAEQQREQATLRLDELRRENEVIEMELAREQESLTELLGEGDPSDQLRLARQRLATAEQALAKVETLEEEAAAAVEAVSQSREEARSRRDELAQRLATLSGQLSREEADPEASTGEASTGEATDDSAQHDGTETPLRQLDQEVRDRLRQALSAHQAESEATDARLAELAADQRAQLHALGLSPEADFSAVLQQARSEAVRRKTSVEELELRLQRYADLEEQLEETRQCFSLYRQLAEDLQPSRFLTYLLEEERIALSRLGSARLEMLTAERYRFSDDGEMDILDLANAEARRDARTLSGGETFLASLALALALAEKVSGRGGRLDAFFLDEGFGSLDPEHLELAMEGIERLASEGQDAGEARLVTLVSHVPEIRQRVDDLIILDKDPASGATVVRQGASRRRFGEDRAMSKAVRTQSWETESPTVETDTAETDTAETDTAEMDAAETHSADSEMSPQPKPSVPLPKQGQLEIF